MYTHDLGVLLKELLQGGLEMADASAASTVRAFSPSRTCPLATSPHRASTHSPSPLCAGSAAPPLCTRPSSAQWGRRTHLRAR